MFFQRNKNIFFWVKVKPNAQKNEIVGWTQQSLKIRLQAPPEKNKANIALIAFLSKILKIPKSNIEIKKGKTSSKKLICIQNQSFDSFSKKMNQIISPYEFLPN